jgi:hypothetical protein
VTSSLLYNIPWLPQASPNHLPPLPCSFSLAASGAGEADDDSGGIGTFSFTVNDGLASCDAGDGVESGPGPGRELSRSGLFVVGGSRDANSQQQCPLLLDGVVSPEDGDTVTGFVSRT